MSKTYLLIIVLLNCSYGQVLKLPNMVSKTWNKASGSSRNPLLSARAYSNALEAAVNSIPRVPSTVAKVFEHIEVPTFISNVNKADIIDQFIIEIDEGNKNEDAKLPIDALLTKYGFPVEIHEVQTEDGYTLKMFRIPGNGTAVFLMHGLLGSADDFLISGRESSLAYILSEKGYDVWFGNARGNKHSRSHINLKPSQASFWDFSWHEIGIYDLPAMIDYVLNKTDCKSLKYIGNSQGTTSFFVMASERKEYNAKVSIMVALSPVAFISHAKSPLVRLLAPGSTFLYGLAKSLGIYEFMPDNKLIRTFKRLICGTGVLAEILCINSLFLIAGFDFEQLNVTNLPVVFGHVPSGASVKQLIHYGQGFISGEFRQFDYGSAENSRRYGGIVPPSYVLENVVAPISMFFSESDWLAGPTDVDKLANRLGNVVDLYKVPYKQFNHLDFLFARDVKKLVYERVLEILSKY